MPWAVISLAQWQDQFCVHVADVNCVYYEKCQVVLATNLGNQFDSIQLLCLLGTAIWINNMEDNIDNCISVTTIYL